MSFFHIGIVSLAAGIIMVAAGLDMQWPGAIMIVAGLAALVFAARQAATRIESPDVDYRSLMAAAIAAQPPPSRLPDRYSRTAVSLSDDEPAHFCINFGGYDHAPIMFPEQKGKPIVDLDVELSSLNLRTQLELAFRAVSGAQKSDTKTVASGESEDDYVCHEAHVPVTRPNVIALRATTVLWNDDARQLADQFAVADEEIEQARQSMRQLDREDRLAHQRRLDEWFARNRPDQSD